VYRDADSAALSAEIMETIQAAAGIGGDVLGQAFRGVYLPDSATVRESADKSLTRS
jgi:hypothetical protein